MKMRLIDVDRDQQATGSHSWTVQERGIRTGFRNAATGAIIAACAFVLPSASFGAEPSPAGKVDTLVIDVATAPASLDPAIACNLEDIGLLSDLYLTLVKYKQNPAKDGVISEDQGEIVPFLAKDWTVSDDGKTYTFHLNEGFTFPSGKPVTAAAVKYSWDRAVKLGSCGNYFLGGGKSKSPLQSVETPDDHTVVVHLSERANNLLPALTAVNTGILDESVLSQQGSTPEEANQWLATHAAGSGPYLLSAYEPGEKAVLVANDNFAGTKPLTKNVEINIIPSDASLLLRARNGASDVTIGLSKQAVASLKDDKRVRIVNTPAAQWTKFTLPTTLAPFDNVKVREALSYAVPYKDILDKVVYGYGSLYFGPYPPQFAAYNPAIGAPRVEDIEKAKRLLDEAGVQLPVTLKVYVRSGQNDQEQVATILQSAWKPLGIDLDISILGPSEYQTAISGEEADYALVGTDGPSVINPEWLLEYDYTSNPEANELLKKAAAEPDAKARQAIWDQIATIWQGDVPRLNLYAQDYIAVLNERVSQYSFGQNDKLLHLWAKN